MSLRISGTGSCLPEKILTNDDLATFLDTNDEWIRTRTGIRERHVLTTESVTDIASKAGQNALDNANIRADELDYILCATLGGDYVTPSLACMVQERLGAHCPALDVNGACSGFLYGLDVAAGFFCRKRAKKILLIAADGLSRIADWTDRATCVLFGDGAGAVILEEGDHLLHLNVTAEGAADPLYMPFQSGNFPLTASNRKENQETFLRMDGATVFKFAVNSIIKEFEIALQKTGMTADQINYVLLHQANMRIIEAARKKLGVPEDRFLTNIDRVGNMSAATIPVLLDACNREGCFKTNDILFMSGFGAGLTTGTVLLRW